MVNMMEKFMGNRSKYFSHETLFESVVIFVGTPRVKGRKIPIINRYNRLGKCFISPFYDAWPRELFFAVLLRGVCAVYGIASIPSTYRPRKIIPVITKPFFPSRIKFASKGFADIFRKFLTWPFPYFGKTVR